jgi:penicillin-binding protein 1A
MKYVLITITILAFICLSAIGITFYSSYALWLNSKTEVINRLYNLRGLLEENRESPISLTPSLKEGRSTVVYDHKGYIIGEFSNGRRRILQLQDIPPLLIETLIMMEDRKFYTHNGFDFRRIASAALINLKTLSFSQGGSTISQQLAKILFTDSQKTIRRKIFELFCTIEIEKSFTKAEILSLYLNSVNFGHFNYGIENAARFYFNKEVFYLNLYDISLLIGMIPNPVRFSPLLYPDRSRRKQGIVLEILDQNGMITRGIQQETVEEYWNRQNSIYHSPTVSFWSMEKNNAPYFVEYVRQYLVNTLGEEPVRRGDLNVYTTLDLEKQIIAETVLGEGLILQGEKTKLMTGEAERKVEGALIVMDPRCGAILAMVGGSGFTFENQFNRATSAVRQVGSSFKPFVYAAAIELKEFSKDDIFIDKPLEIDTPQGLWKPANYNDRYYGPVTLETALKMSLNSVAVQLLQETGPEPVIELMGKALDLDKAETLKRFDPYPSLALGVYSFSPLEFARAYSIFANRGEKVIPHTVLWIENGRGDILLNNERDIKKLRTEYDLENKLRVIRYDTAQKINQMLSGVLKKGGTAHRALQSSGLAIDAYGKTGTTNNFADAWFIGYTDTIVTAIWIGYDDPLFTLGNGQSGGVVAAPIWAEFMKRALWREE